MGMLRYIFEIKKLVKGNYDIVHSHLSVFSGFVLLGAKLGGARIRIAHSRSGPLPDEVKNFSVKRKALLFFYHWLIGITATHRISCSSDAALYLFGKKAVSSNKVIYIRNAVDFNRFIVQKDATEIRKKYGIEIGTQVFTNVGNLLPVKNQVFLVDIFYEYQKMNRQSVLLIAGEGPEREAIQRKISELNINNTILLGRCDTVPELLSITDYFIMTSKYEGVPGAAIEALASGVPCYLSDKITRDIDFGERITKYFSIELDPVSIARTIFESSKKMSHSKEQFQMILENNGYEINEACEKMLEVYKES